jgi:cell division protease FtsH
MQVPTEDRFLMKKSELLNKIASLLGGRAAEDIIFGDISTGAHNDLARATDIAKSMIREYGMSETLGQVHMSPEKRLQKHTSWMDTCQATADMIDREMREIMAREYSRALEILRSTKDTLVKGARLLLEKEKIDGPEIKAMMG